MQIIPKPEWRDLVTFVPNKRVPIHNWFHYKEGFSQELVAKVIDEFAITDGTILDPFCGVGTTLLACKERGIDAIGLDVLPLAMLASRAKTADYDIESLKNNAKRLLKKRFEQPDVSDVPKIMKISFSKYALDDVMFFRDAVMNMDENRDFFMLALIKAAINVSWTWKDGAVIKIRKRNVAPLRIMLRRTIYNMIRDLKRAETKKCKIRIEQGDARNMPLRDESVDAIITSPPYLNNIDYTKVYAIENFIATGATAPAIRSFIDDNAYFTDMTMVIKEMWRVCKNGARCCIVVGNAPQTECDLELAKISESIGFTIDKIYNAKQRFELEDRTIKKGVLRESVIMMEK